MFFVGFVDYLVLTAPPHLPHTQNNNNKTHTHTHNIHTHKKHNDNTTTTKKNTYTHTHTHTHIVTTTGEMITSPSDRELVTQGHDNASLYILRRGSVSVMREGVVVERLTKPGNADADTETQTHTHTYRQTDTHTHRQTDGHTHTHRPGHTHALMHTYMYLNTPFPQIHCSIIFFSLPHQIYLYLSLSLFYLSLSLSPIYISLSLSLSLSLSFSIYVPSGSTFGEEALLDSPAVLSAVTDSECELLRVNNK